MQADDGHDGLRQPWQMQFCVASRPSFSSPSVAAEMRMDHVPRPPVSVVTGPPDVCQELRLKCKPTQ